MEFRVLGPMEIWDNRSRVELRAAKQQALLAALLIQVNTVIEPDHLVDMLWSGEAPATAKATLHSLVYRLRRTLATSPDPHAAVLSGSSQGYILRVVPQSVDLYRFERSVAAGQQALDSGDYGAASELLGTALELWRGEAFAGIEVSAVREYANGLEMMRLDATEWHLAANLQLGGRLSMIRQLESLTATHPYREGFWELLMRAQYQAGRQADALETYQRLYRLLDDDLGIEPSPSTRELHQQILSGTAGATVAPVAPSQVEDLAEDLAEELAPGPRESIEPRSLPLGIRGFAGRVEELKTLDALLPDAGDTALSPPAVFLITGTAGIGKTTLAVHWAHRVSDCFPDGQLYVNLHGFAPSGGAMRWSEAVRFFLDALGVIPARIPREPVSQVALYRSLLAGKRVLVILDNAADEGQVRPLLPASVGCLALVTSRRRLGGLVAAEAAQPLALGPLSVIEAHDLLVHRLGGGMVTAEPQATRDIIANCGGLPLALAIVAARAATHPELPLHSQVRQLRDSPPNLDPFGGGDPATNLRTVFSWSYQALRSESARLFRLLGLHPGPDITVPAAASLTSTSTKEVRAQLGELTDAQLVTEHRPGRFVLHDLLRTYAYELAHSQHTAAERHLAIQRIARHYAGTAYAAAMILDPRRRTDLAGLLQPDGPTQQITDEGQAMSWFDAERSVLLAVVSLAASNGLRAQVLQLVWALSDFCQRRGLWHDKETSFRIALDLARRLDDQETQAWVHRDLGRVYAMVDRFDEAETHLRRALEIAIALGDSEGQGAALQDLGLVLGRQQRDSEALDHDMRAAALFREAGSARAESSALNAIGWRLAQLGDYQNALTYCRQALTKLQEIGDVFTQPDTWDSLGYIHHLQGDYQQATECYRQALDLFERLGRRYGQADTLTRLGDTLHAADDVESGRHHWRHALAILKELDHPDADKVKARLTDGSRRYPS
ncbi:AfsR/SARP family transcriptional regulator [Flindersiella endophytica]